jgi:hypothetical protein
MRKRCLYATKNLGLDFVKLEGFDSFNFDYGGIPFNHNMTANH